MNKNYTFLIFFFIGIKLFAQQCVDNTNSLVFNGDLNSYKTASRVIIDTQSKIISDSSLTVEAWINLSQLGNATHLNSVVSTDGFGYTGIGEAGFNLRTGNGVVEFIICGDSLGKSKSWSVASSPKNSITINTWTHVAGTYDGDSLKLFINGFKISAKRFNGKIHKMQAYPLTIGNWADSTKGSRCFKGRIDEVRIWNRALSETELNSNMSTYINPNNQVSLFGYWQFNEGIGNSVSDLSSNKFIGKILNSSWDTIVPFDGSFVINSIVGISKTDSKQSFGYKILGHVGSTYNWTATNGSVVSGQGTDSVRVRWNAKGGLGKLVLIESNNGCSDTTELSVLINGVGIKEIDNLNAVSIAPNPVKGNAQFTFDNNNYSTLRIINLLGEEVAKINVERKSSVQFNSSNLNSGIYLYQILDGTQIITTKKMIVE